MSLMDFLASITILSIVKVLLLALLLVYTIFAYLMMRQMRAMTRAITMRDDYLIRGLGLAHFLAAIVITIMALLIL